MKTIKAGQKYRHYKNKDYVIIGIAQHSETLENLVIYKALYGEGLIWARPLDMFIDNKEFQGHVVERFKLIEES